MSLGVWVEAGFAEQERRGHTSTAADPEYVDFLYASGLAAACFTFFFFSSLDFIVGCQWVRIQSTCCPSPPVHPNMQDNRHQSVHTLIYKHDLMVRTLAINNNQ